MKTLLHTIALLALTFFLSGCGNSRSAGLEEITKPNIILVLADDLGYGDLSCYGQSRFETPNLDRLAAEGIQFTRHYAGSTVCAPSRSVLMTGLHTGHTPIRGNREVWPEGQAPLPDSALTMAEVLRAAGYVTGAFGKWGLGYSGSEGDPLNQGFDTFFGYNCQRYAHRYYPAYLWDNHTKYFLEGNDWAHTSTYAPDLIQERVLRFIRENRDTSFFAYIPLVLPHAELIAPDDTLLRKYSGLFPEKPYTGGAGADYGPGMNIGAYCSQPEPRATFAAMVERIDVYMGEIMDLLDELGISENTVLLFSSDNGPHAEGGADPEFFNSNGGLRGIKRDLYEGGIRVPFLVRWPGTIEPERETDHLSAFWDLLPTVAEIAGAETGHCDGISFLPLLLGIEQPRHEYLYWEFHEQGGKQAMLKDGWKAIRLEVGDTLTGGRMELYFLEDDPGESNDLSTDRPELVNEFIREMERARTPSPGYFFR
jgi:arylsulfatase A-like enzyme